MRRLVQIVAVVGLLLVVPESFAAPHAKISSRPIKHPAPGTSIKLFARVDKGIYRGSPPKNDADFQFLRSLGVHYIINLEFWPFLAIPEREKAKKYGITYIPVFIPGMPVEPSEKNVNRALMLLRTHRHQGVYLHCILGRDRSSLVSALYKMYFLGESQQDAWRNDFLAFNYKDRWTLRGLVKYFREHPKRPPALEGAGI